MSKFTKFFAIGAIVLAGAVSTAAAADKMRFIVVSHGPANDPYHSVVKNGLMQAASDLGVDVEYRANETFDVVKMGQLIDAAVNQQPDGLIVTIPDVSALGASIHRAVASGIPVVSYNSGLKIYKDVGTLVHVGQDEYMTGTMAGEAFKNMGAKNVVCLNHEVGNATQDDRCRGLSDAYEGKIKVIPGKPDPSANASIVKAAVQSDSTIDGVFCTSTVLCAEPATKALREVGSQALVGSTSLSSAFLDSVGKGEAAFAMDQQQFLQGYLPVSILYNYIRFDLLPPAAIITGPQVITKDKVGRLAELASKGIR